jgi:hypothetical protein
MGFEHWIGFMTAFWRNGTNVKAFQKVQQVLRELRRSLTTLERKRRLLFRRGGCRAYE